MARSEKNEVVSKAEAGRRWNVSPAAVTKYLIRGLPVRGDGKLDWDRAEDWRRQFVCAERSGNFRSRNSAVASVTPVASASFRRQPKDSPDFNLGAAWMASELCNSARTAWPEFVGTLNFKSVPIDKRIAFRVLITGLMSRLIEKWSTGFVQTDQLAPIDWSAFGSEAATAEREFSEVFAELA